MRLMFIRLFESYYDEPFRNAFKKLGFEVEERAYYTPKDSYKDERLQEMFRQDLKEKAMDAVITVNFWPLLAMVLEEYGIPYISWSYDAPQNLSKTDGMEYENNYIFLFDAADVQRYREEGITRVFHMPLAVDVDFWERMTKNYRTYGKLTKAAFQSDVSLVGSLYNSSFPAIRSQLGTYEEGLINGFCDAQKKLYGCYMIPELLTEEVMQKLRRSFPKNSPLREIRKSQLSYSIATYLTSLDRYLLLHFLSETYDTALFTFQKKEEVSARLPKVRVEGSVDYMTEMPQVFAASKINLCPTLRCIASGIPLRALDVMGCGGFLLTPSQPELLEYFVPNQDAGIYTSIEEALDLANYYLREEEKRQAVALSGREKVRQAFRIEDRLQQMMEFVKEK